MAIKFRETWANLNAWDVTQTVGSVSVASNQLTIVPGDVAVNLTGIVMKDPVSLAEGDIIFWHSLLSSSAGNNNALVGGIDETGIINFASGIDFYVNGGSPTVYGFDHPSTTNIGSLTIGGAGNVLKIVAGTGTGNDFCDLYIDASNVFTTVNFGSSPLFPTDQYFKFNIHQVNGSSGTFKSDYLYWTDSNGLTPPTPSGLVASNPTTTTIDLDWTDVATTVSADGISVEISTVGGGVGFTEYDFVDIGDETIVVSGLDPGTEYFFRIRAKVTAVAVDYYSSYTAEDSETTLVVGPSADAGPDQLITWPTNTATMAATATNETSILWTKVSGPGTVSFNDATIEDPIATVSASGTYVLNLHVEDDDEATDDDTVTIVFNEPPVASAGPDQVILDPLDTFTLAGSATDDGLPAVPGALTYLWEKVSGPGTATFVDDTDPETDVSMDATGAYVLRLTVDDGDTTDTDTMTATINIAPSVAAGADQDVLQTDGADLDGTATDADGLPDPPGALTTTWSKVSGPGTVTFANASAVDTHADFSLGGVYVLRLTGYDGAETVTDDLTITVDGYPVVDAGVDQKHKDPTVTVQLAGSVTDDGLPDPPNLVTALWTKVSGPGTVTFLDDTDTATTCTVDAAGIYLLRLTGDDSTQTASDTMTLKMGIQEGMPVPFKARALGRI